MENYEIDSIKTLRDALRVRIIRNQCRAYMTNNSSGINYIQQIIWYLRIYKSENRKRNIICYIFKVNKKSVGFGLIRKSKGKYWITGGLKSNQRGKGMGTFLFKKLIENIRSNEVWLEVLESNNVARNLYLKLGFKKTGVKEIKGENVIIMKLSKKPKNEKI